MRGVGSLLISTILISGCASIIKGSSQSVSIATPPTTGATCTLTSGTGSWTVTTPGTVTVDKSKTDIQAHCTKPGWQDATIIIPSNFQGWTLGNIIIGGLIGVGIDAATGAINEYPSAFNIPLTADPNPVPPTSLAPSDADKPPGV